MGEQLAWQPPAPATSPEQEIAQHAAVLMGWAGVVLPELTIFGSRVLPVVVPDPAVHQARQHSGDTPESDSDTLTVWECPEAVAPAPAVRLAGALFPVREGTVRGFGRVVGEARRWRPSGPAAVLAPPAVLDDGVSGWECALHGVGLAPTSSVPAGEVVRAEPGRRAPARRRYLPGPPGWPLR